ncbi:TonB-dependent receptor [Altererythrobacter xiamenensis]|uniref:TonB-dependent receptor n=1 Tax=Altererythrobacter xiamenensis TaxID=1316679 RepID=A0A1Y6F8X8_9SPHN|nr:TonB-dependent receptor [Altererythrobacter xiamenensis]SMQ69820.1 TonB-dependent receptor [Altererythrobacter xiamenensis]
MKLKSVLSAGAAAAAILAPATAFAGDIRGQVTDAEDTVSVRAAEVRIVELDRQTTTERDGTFSFYDVPAGTYKIEVSYIGAATQTRSVTVSDTGVERVDFALSSAGDGNILVIGQIANQASALSRKRASDLVSDGLTRDAIGQFPDQNVAESLRRLPGVNVLNDQGEGRFVSVRGLDPTLNATSINGVRLPSPENDVRAVALDVISSDIIESVEVKKSLTPDMDADTIGASIEIETTSAFDRQQDLFVASIGGSYNDLSEQLTPDLSADFSVKLGENVGISGGVSFYNREFETDNIEADDWEEDGLIYAEEIQYRDYDVERERISATLGLDFRVGDSTELYVKGIWSQFDDQEFRRRLIFDLGDAGVSGSSDAPLYDDDEAITVERDVKDRFERQRIRSIAFGGESDWDAWFAEYSVSYAKSSEFENGSLDPTQFEREFEAEGLQVGFDFSAPRLPIYSVAADPTGDFFDPAAYELNDIELTALSDSEDEEYAAKFDVGRRFIGDTGTFTVQAGFKGRWREKSFNGEIQFYENDNFFMSDALGIGQTYRIADLDPLPGLTESTDFFFANFGDFELQEIDSQFDSNVEDFVVEEDILAGYLLGRWDSSDFTVIAGVRYEDTSNTLSGNDVLLVEEDGILPGGAVATDDTVLVTPTTTTRNYDHWLPSINIRYEAQDDLILRLAGYRSIVRPGPFQQAPRITVEEADDGEREGEFGNPSLRPTEAWNIDAAAEYYMSNNGAIFASVFYKSVEDFIVEQNFDNGGVFNGVTFDEATIFTNGDERDIFGFELGFAQAFGGPLDGFVVQANYTFTDADGTITTVESEGPRNIPLPTTSKHTANFSVGFDKGPFDIRLSGTYRDGYLDELSDEADLDRYVDDHFQLDLSAKFRATDNLQFYYEWVNINDAEYFAFNRLGGRENLLQYEEYSWTMKFGARYTF